MSACVDVQLGTVQNLLMLINLFQATISTLTHYQFMCEALHGVCSKAAAAWTVAA